MIENSHSISARLQKAGKWGAFKRRCAELEESGTKAKTAYYIALGEIDGVEYIPTGVRSGEKVSSGVKLGGGVEMAGLSRDLWKSRPASTLKADVQWVYDNLCFGDIEAVDAPSAGAWNMRQRVLGNAAFADTFWRELLPKALLARQATEELPAGATGKNALDLIEGIRAALLDQMSDDSEKAKSGGVG